MPRRLSKGHSNIDKMYLIVITSYDYPKRQQLHRMNSLRKTIPPIGSFQQCPFALKCACLKWLLVIHLEINKI